jgi:hypothetical protein
MNPIPVPQSSQYTPSRPRPAKAPATPRPAGAFTVSRDLSEEENAILRKAFMSKPMELEFETAWLSDAESLPLGSIELAEITIAFKLSLITGNPNQVYRIFRTWKHFNAGRWRRRSHGESIIRLGREMARCFVTPLHRCGEVVQTIGQYCEEYSI